MRRRRLLALIGGAAAWPVSASAQKSGKGPLIGFLFFGTPGHSPEIEAFQQGLAELNYTEGQNIRVAYRYAAGDVAKLPNLARELTDLRPDIIVTLGTPAAVAAKHATSTIPIVIVGIADAVGAGLVAKLAPSGGNITGLTSISAELGGKRLELLKAMVPDISRVAVLYDPDDAAGMLVLNQLHDAAPALGLTLHSHEVRAPHAFESAFAGISRDRADALFGVPGVLTFAHASVLVDHAVEYRLPAMWGHRQFVEAGGLMSYAVNFYDQCRRAASFVDQVLRGAKPSDLPIQQPTQFELVINLKAARALNLSIPPTLLARADEVIE